MLFGICDCFLMLTKSHSREIYQKRNEKEQGKALLVIYINVQLIKKQIPIIHIIRVTPFFPRFP